MYIPLPSSITDIALLSFRVIHHYSKEKPSTSSNTNTHYCFARWSKLCTIASGLLLSLFVFVGIFVDSLCDSVSSAGYSNGGSNKINNNNIARQKIMRFQRSIVDAMSIRPSWLTCVRARKFHVMKRTASKFSCF
mmetsp:Transcript_26855/g.45777  ORF Transcript_26855/g.45777 Transcript_26855/m.45777 type:complete len:135 (-) Transcript_26855:275-679(-)